MMINPSSNLSWTGTVSGRGDASTGGGTAVPGVYWTAMCLSVPYFQQEQRYTCGIACLRMVMHHFGGQQTEAEIETVAVISPVLGTTCRAIAEAATVLGYRAAVERGMFLID